ncbi:hypothetical protein [Schlesneria sp. T3-172]|uniref:hypothetical protein n=1 Tax=Schlesneria sphaerica TaxID=3373610 RepID=UPI0037C6D290
MPETKARALARHYSDAARMQATHMFVGEGMTIGQISRKVNVPVRIVVGWFRPLLKRAVR